MSKQMQALLEQDATLRHASYCGMAGLAKHGSYAELRDMAARRLRLRRKAGFPVTTLAHGFEWEVMEPEGCNLVPDACGILSIELA
jgi:hypothetical protein